MRSRWGAKKHVVVGYCGTRGGERPALLQNPLETMLYNDWGQVWPTPLGYLDQDPKDTWVVTLGSKPSPRSSYPGMD